jgi:hypothetical protein
MHRTVFAVLGVLTFVAVAPASAQPAAATFQGYWMGIDPVDGGDSRRSIIEQADGTFALIGRDTVLTLCDDTDRGVATFTDGRRTARDRMASEHLRIHCFNTSAEVVIKAAYRLLDAGTMIEELTLPSGTPFATIVFHRASASSQPPARLFQGYWMGVDPVDGGDARRSFVAQSRNTYSMIGRDTVLSLCDSTDRGVATLDDGVADGRTGLSSESLTIQCFNNGSSVVLRSRFEIVDPNTMIETTSLENGTPVSVIVLHRTSAR